MVNKNPYSISSERIGDPNYRTRAFVVTITAYISFILFILSPLVVSLHFWDPWGLPGAVYMVMAIFCLGAAAFVIGLVAFIMNTHYLIMNRLQERNRTVIATSTYLLLTLWAVFILLTASHYLFGTVYYEGF